MGIPVRIRPLADAEEAARCAALMVASEPWLTLRATFERALALLQDPEREVYVCADGEDLQGFIVLALTGAFVGYIQVVCVAPGARGQGVGSGLIAFAEQRIARVAPTVFICVSSFNQRARALYERLGYQRIGELPDYIERGYSEILLWKRHQTRNEFVAQRESAAGVAKPGQEAAVRAAP